tara:strand:- start:18 stop:218 length:201 start_codon:yes stop_codon:yes gene_type:complete
MAKAIKELLGLPKEEQEFILHSLANEYNPIEIDGEVYMIPQEVNELIDNLIIQVQELRVGKEINKG